MQRSRDPNHWLVDNEIRAALNKLGLDNIIFVSDLLTDEDKEKLLEPHKKAKEEKQRLPNQPNEKEEDIPTELLDALYYLYQDPIDAQIKKSDPASVYYILNVGDNHWVWMKATFNKKDNNVSIYIEDSRKRFDLEKYRKTIENTFSSIRNDDKNFNIGEIKAIPTGTQEDGWTCGYRAIVGALKDYLKQNVLPAKRKVIEALLNININDLTLTRDEKEKNILQLRDDIIELIVQEYTSDEKINTIEAEIHEIYEVKKDNTAIDHIQKIDDYINSLGNILRNINEASKLLKNVTGTDNNFDNIKIHIENVLNELSTYKDNGGNLFYDLSDAINNQSRIDPKNAKVIRSLPILALEKIEAAPRPSTPPPSDLPPPLPFKQQPTIEPEASGDTRDESRDSGSTQSTNTSDSDSPMPSPISADTKKPLEMHVALVRKFEVLSKHNDFWDLLNQSAKKIANESYLEFFKECLVYLANPTPEKWKTIWDTFLKVTDEGNNWSNVQTSKTINIEGNISVGIGNYDKSKDNEPTNKQLYGLLFNILQTYFVIGDTATVLLNTTKISIKTLNSQISDAMLQHYGEHGTLPDDLKLMLNNLVASAKNKTPTPKPNDTTRVPHAAPATTSSDTHRSIEKTKKSNLSETVESIIQNLKDAINDLITITTRARLRISKIKKNNNCTYDVAVSAYVKECITEKNNDIDIIKVKYNEAKKLLKKLSKTNELNEIEQNPKLLQEYNRAKASIGADFKDGDTASSNNIISYMLKIKKDNTPSIIKEVSKKLLKSIRGEHKKDSTPTGEAQLIPPHEASASPTPKHITFRIAEQIKEDQYPEIYNLLYKLQNNAENIRGLTNDLINDKTYINQLIIDDIKKLGLISEYKEEHINLLNLLIDSLNDADLNKLFNTIEEANVNCNSLNNSIEKMEDQNDKETALGLFNEINSTINDLRMRYKPDDLNKTKEMINATHIMAGQAALDRIYVAVLTRSPVQQTSAFNKTKYKNLYKESDPILQFITNLSDDKITTLLGIGDRYRGKISQKQYEEYLNEIITAMPEFEKIFNDTKNVYWQNEIININAESKAEEPELVAAPQAAPLPSPTVDEKKPETGGVRPLVPPNISQEVPSTSTQTTDSVDAQSTAPSIAQTAAPAEKQRPSEDSMETVSSDETASTDSSPRTPTSNKDKEDSAIAAKSSNAAVFVPDTTLGDIINKQLQENIMLAVRTFFNLLITHLVKELQKGLPKPKGEKGLRPKLKGVSSAKIVSLTNAIDSINKLTLAESSTDEDALQALKKIKEIIGNIESPKRKKKLLAMIDDDYSTRTIYKETPAGLIDSFCQNVKELVDNDETRKEIITPLEDTILDKKLTNEPQEGIIIVANQDIKVKQLAGNAMGSPVYKAQIPNPNGETISVIIKTSIAEDARENKTTALPNELKQKYLTRLYQSIPFPSQGKEQRVLEISAFCKHGDIRKKPSDADQQYFAQQCLRSMRKMVDAFNSEGIYFPDIKPANFLIADDGRMVISDTKTLINVREKDPAQFPNKGIIPTDAYWPAGAKTNPTIDLVNLQNYLIGVSIYEIATGTLPDKDETTGKHKFDFTHAAFQGDLGEPLLKQIESLTSPTFHPEQSHTDEQEQVDALNTTPPQPDESQPAPSPLEASHARLFSAKPPGSSPSPAGGTAPMATPLVIPADLQIMFKGLFKTVEEVRMSTQLLNQQLNAFISDVDTRLKTIRRGSDGMPL